MLLTILQCPRHPHSTELFSSEKPCSGGQTIDEQVINNYGLNWFATFTEFSPEITVQLQDLP